MRQLGAGRTGRVFLATYQSTGAYVAIKYLNATLRRDAEFMERFRSDTHHLVELDDPNVVRLYEYVETPARAAVVMELVDGVSLRTLLAEHGHVTPEAALTVLKGVLAALAAAHERGVAHRDVKPDNVLVQADGTSKLADFGVVVHAEEPGVPAGSPAYMAPELWTRHQAGPPADLYAAACTLFEAVRGRPPFRAVKEGTDELDVPATRDRHLVEPIPLEVVPDTLRDLLRRGLAKDPAERYASARRFAAELEEDAVAGYGADWEKRGRRHLAELATLLALRFPLARTERATGAGAALALRDRMARMPRLPPHLWVTGALVAAVAIGIVLSGGRLPSGPGAILMPPPEEKSEPAPSPADAMTRAVPSRTAAATPARTSGAPAPGRTPTATAPATVPPPPPPQPTSGQGGSAVPRAAVQAATILRWSGRAGAVQVTATGPGQVRLLVTYTRRDGDSAAATTLRREARVLSGRTRYTSEVGHDPGEVACGRRAYFGVLVMTEPASGNGPQVSEAAVDGPACPTPAATQPAPSSPAPPPPTPAPAAPTAARETAGRETSAGETSAGQTSAGETSARETSALDGRAPTGPAGPGSSHALSEPPPDDGPSDVSVDLTEAPPVEAASTGSAATPVPAE
ncbi:protein kinase [Actinomadura sp. ATCC 31491]|uniref:non-specific serine/threonine protein kinase n=1 Tax=Actinomadura luzonensis TaxID=2805427 RepID=A0ABT0G4L8_9ACTN|nr:serine/threonine-protein kinase [Actinomadura luzonensis]MCK2219544.1 protein kinase [Actinomadura luzonensis]